jgi:hypothetical protein
MNMTAWDNDPRRGDGLDAGEVRWILKTLVGVGGGHGADGHEDCIWNESTIKKVQLRLSGEYMSRLQLDIEFPGQFAESDGHGLYYDSEYQYPRGHPALECQRRALRSKRPDAGDEPAVAP